MNAIKYARRFDGRIGVSALVLAVGLTSVGCRSPEAYRLEADRAAAQWIALAHSGSSNLAPFRVERPSERFRRRLLEMQALPQAFREALAEPPASVQPTNVIRLTLAECLRIAMENSREYQSAREEVFLAALDLDLESDAFRSSFAGLLSAEYADRRSQPPPQRSIGHGSQVVLERKHRHG